MILTSVLAAYAAAWLLTARWLYGRWRGELMAIGGFDHYCRHCRTISFTAASERETVARAAAAAAAWPVTFLIFLVVFRPPPTAAEQAAAEKKLNQRIAELEHELGIKS